MVMVCFDPPMHLNISILCILHSIKSYIICYLFLLCKYREISICNKAKQLRRPTPESDWLCSHWLTLLKMLFKSFMMPMFCTTHVFYTIYTCLYHNCYLYHTRIALQEVALLCTPIYVLGQDKSLTNNLASQKSKLYSVRKKS